MNDDARRIVRCGSFLAILALSGTVLLCSIRATGQSTGNNAVYNSSGSCSPVCAASTAFIDASLFIGIGNKQSPNICGVIYGILSSNFYSYPAVGAVIDARGISGSTALTCPAGTTPWNNGTTFLNVPSNILLPAGTIVISTGWVLPANTHLFGQGDNISSGTVIQAASNVGDIIAYCSSVVPPQNPSTSSCTGIGVEKLVLDGKGNSVNGIVNYYAGSLSYVDHVGLYQILGTGLLVAGAATGSGPYSNINFDTGSSTASSSTVCAQIGGHALQGTSGIRGLRCTSELADGTVAVLLDSSNNSLKDVSIAGFRDGILVGSNGTAQNNVLIDVIGDTTNPCYPNCIQVINAVHISLNNTVSDLVIMGLSNQGGGGTSTIADEVTSTILTSITDPFVAIYALGKIANNGHARFTTSPTVATWAAGAGTPTGTCSQGSLYSCASMSSSSCNSFALWGCPAPGGTWAHIK